MRNDSCQEIGMDRFESVESSPKLVVLVEDDALIRTLAAQALRDADFIVIEAQDASEAMRLLGYVSSSVHVLFTDMQMPGEMNGLGLIKHADEAWPWISLLLASGVSSPLIGNAPPDCRFLAKPYDLRQMVAEVRMLAWAAAANLSFWSASDEFDDADDESCGRYQTRAARG
jgi:DNA-binding NtrC family response regulator